MVELACIGLNTSYVYEMNLLNPSERLGCTLMPNFQMKHKVRLLTISELRMDEVVPYYCVAPKKDKSFMTTKGKSIIQILEISPLSQKKIFGE